MVEGAGGQGPEILIAGKNTPIEDIRRQAEATGVNPHEPLPKHTPEQPRPKPEAVEPGISRGEAVAIAGIATVARGAVKRVGEFVRTRREKREEKRKEKEALRTPQEPVGPAPEPAAAVAPPQKDIPAKEGEARNYRDFHKILKDKRKVLQGPPDETKENELIFETAWLIRDAKDTGAFRHLKEEMREIQTYHSYPVAREKIFNLHLGNFELEAGASENWDSRFEGVLAEYRDVAVLNMDLAMLWAKGEGNSEEAKKLDREIHLRGWGGSPIQGLEGLARKYLEEGEQAPEGQIQAGGEIPGKELSAQIVKAIQRGQKEGTKEALKAMAAQQAKELGDVFGRLPAEEERANWVDLEYRQDFWTRFEPRSWPRFYEKMGPEERRPWDARWQLARASFFKRATAAFPEKYVENQDLALLGKDQMELLFGVEGVPDILKGYANLLVGGDRRADLGSIWECKDQDSFERVRQELRENLLRNPEFFKGVPDEIRALRAKEADAVAWNLLCVSLLPESIDSRYSYTGGKHGDLPGAIVADEYRTILHPQERAETKWAAKHNEWGTFGPWGSTQMGFIESATRFNPSNDEWLFTPAERNRYWRHRTTNLDPSDPRKREKRGRVIEVFVPEVYPVVTTGSFLEETRAGDKTLLEHIIKSGGKDIPWADVKADAWVIYQTGKFNKAVKLFDYWFSGKTINLGAYGWGKEWSGPLKEIMFQRLKLERVIDGLRRDRKTHQSFHNLKVLPIYAASGGVRDVTAARPEPNLTWEAKKIITGVLGHSRIGYLGRREGLALD